MKEQIRLTAKVAAIVLTDFACWFPIIIIGILVQAGALTLPPDVFAWCVTFVLPINSAINPYLYTIAAIINSRLRRTRITPAESQQENTSRRGQMFQSQNTLDTDLRHASNAPRKVTVTDESNVWVKCTGSRLISVQWTKPHRSTWFVGSGHGLLFLLSSSNLFLSHINHRLGGQHTNICILVWLELFRWLWSHQDPSGATGWTNKHTNQHL